MSRNMEESRAFKEWGAQSTRKYCKNLGLRIKRSRNGVKESSGLSPQVGYKALRKRMPRFASSGLATREFFL